MREGVWAPSRFYVTYRGRSSRVLRRQKLPLFRQQRLKAPAGAARAWVVVAEPLAQFPLAPLTARSPRLTLASDGKPRRRLLIGSKGELVLAALPCHRLCLL